MHAQDVFPVPIGVALCLGSSTSVLTRALRKAFGLQVQDVPFSCPRYPPRRCIRYIQVLLGALDISGTSGLSCSAHRKGCLVHPLSSWYIHQYQVPAEDVLHLPPVLTRGILSIARGESYTTFNNWRPLGFFNVARVIPSICGIQLGI
jgi:hypothetical protein